MVESLQKKYWHMKDRCYNPRNKSYTSYGGRGISICDEWLSDYMAFESWALSHGWVEGLAIDRIDNNGNYSPGNCRFVTAAENNQNRRTTKFYTINGETKNLQQWCDFYGVSRSMVNRRLMMGWDIEKALTTPKKQRDTSALVGKRFGRILVVKYVGASKTRQSLYECLCDCGKTCIIDGNKLSTGHTRSCGCLKLEMMQNSCGDYRIGLKSVERRD